MYSNNKILYIANTYNERQSITNNISILGIKNLKKTEYDTILFEIDNHNIVYYKIKFKV